MYLFQLHSENIRMRFSLLWKVIKFLQLSRLSVDPVPV